MKREKVGTILGVNPPSRFGEIKLKNDEVVEFSEKPEFQDEWINGGYFFFQKGFFEIPFPKRKLCTGEATFRLISQKINSSTCTVIKDFGLVWILKETGSLKTNYGTAETLHGKYNKYYLGNLI